MDVGFTSVSAFTRRFRSHHGIRPSGVPKKFARSGKPKSKRGFILPSMSKITLIALGVSDLPKSIAFYRDNAGFELQNQFGSIAFFSGGPITLMLNEELHRPDRPLAGAMEIVLAVDSVAASYRSFAERGCTFVNEPREVTPGSWATTFTDPDGHWLTLFGPQ
jgi:predicted enzyme related to lactoylglutathione lyase